MFTSRAEYRLLLREDNADYRLIEFGRDFGTISDDSWNRFQHKRRVAEKELERLRNTRIKPGEAVNQRLERLSTSKITESFLLSDLLRRPQLNYSDICEISPPEDSLEADAAEHVEAEIKYEGYVDRQHNEVAKVKRLEELPIPIDFDFDAEADKLSTEARQKLTATRPRTLGQASRISGVSPADVSALMIILHVQRQTQVPQEK